MLVGEATINAIASPPPNLLIAVFSLSGTAGTYIYKQIKHSQTRLRQD
jgi:tRNA U34 5-carboxymethylaminomethyl modifying GTPase MnmE/TrmE